MFLRKFVYLELRGGIMLKTSIESGINLGESGSYEVFKYLRSLGYDAVDYQAFSCEPAKRIYALDDKEFDEFVLRDAAYAKEAGIEIIQTHGPWPYDDSKPEQYEPKLEAMKKAIRGSALIGAQFVVMHPVIPTWQESPNHAEHFAENVRYFKLLSEYAKEYGVKIALENMPGRFVCCGPVRELADCIDAVDSESLVACLDTGHANYSAKRYVSRENIGDAVRTLGDRLACLHIHDNDGQEDQHLMPYYGIIDWGNFVSALKEIHYKGPINFECHTTKAPAPLKLQSDKWLLEVARYFAKEADCD